MRGSVPNITVDRLDQWELIREDMNAKKNLVDLIILLARHRSLIDSWSDLVNYLYFIL